MIKELDIPFEVIETPRHVYLVVYPEEDKTIVESTDPKKGYRYYSEEAQRGM